MFGKHYSLFCVILFPALIVWVTRTLQISYNFVSQISTMHEATLTKCNQALLMADTAEYKYRADSQFSSMNHTKNHDMLPFWPYIIFSSAFGYVNWMQCHYAVKRRDIFEWTKWIQQINIISLYSHSNKQNTHTFFKC